MQKSGALAGYTRSPGQECLDSKGADCKGACNGICERKPSPQICGTRQGLICPAGLKCVDDEDDWCDPTRGELLCAGTCQKPRSCGGAGNGTCNANQRCVNQYGDDCASALRPGDCTGTCRRVCGGNIAAHCLSGKSCVDFPGSSSGLGICRKKPYPVPGTLCGAKTGKICPAGYRCVDRPADLCDPELGSADCPGMCMPLKHGLTPTATAAVSTSTIHALTTTAVSAVSTSTPTTLSTKLCYTQCVDYVNDCGVKYGG